MRVAWRTWVVVTWAVVVATACATTYNTVLAGCGYGGILLGDLKAPIVARLAEVFPINRPLDATFYEGLEDVTLDRRVGTTCPDLQSDSTTSRLFGGKRRDCVDTFDDFRPWVDWRARDTLVVVAISGGGTRAAMLGAHVMALLERRFQKLFPDLGAMFPRIDAFSTVSGGSIYAYHLARRWRDVVAKGLDGACDGSRPTTDDDPVAEEQCDKGKTFLRDTANDRFTRLGTQALAASAFIGVVGAYGTGIVTSVLTDRTYVHQLAKGLEWSQRPWLAFSPLDTPVLQFADIPMTPRFMFNATALETGGPVALTQRVTNLPPETPEHRSTRLDLGRPICAPEHKCTRSRPIRSSLTLEEIGSSPASFGVAYAAAASAAFPFATDPLPLATYQYRPTQQAFSRTEATLSLVDGGVFDNSGVTSGVDLFEYLAQMRGVHHLVLIAINADATRYDAELPARAARPDSPAWLGPSWPLPTLFSGANSLNLIHFTNKRRSEDLAWDRLLGLLPWLNYDHTLARAADHSAIPVDATEVIPEELKKPTELRRQFAENAGSWANGASSAELAETFIPLFETAQRKEKEEEQVERLKRYVHYFPINLSQLSSLDPHAVPGGQTFYDKVLEVGTAYWSKWGDDAVLEAAAQKLLSVPQQDGWSIGPACTPAHGGKLTEVHRLDDAVAIAFARSMQRQWEDDLSVAAVDRWCGPTGSAP